MWVIEELIENMLAQIRNFFTKGDARSLVVKKNMIGSIFIKGISILIQLILVPLTLGYLSQELYGVWLTISSIMLWLNFFDVGLTLGLKNRLSEAIARNDAFAPAYKKAGILFLARGDYDDALEYFEDYTNLGIPEEESIKIKELMERIKNRKHDTK